MSLSGTGRVAQAAIWLLALVLLGGRLTYPPGYMPEWSGSGLSLVPCDGFSRTPQARTHGDGHHRSPGDAPIEIDPKTPCPYAAAASATAYLDAESIAPSTFLARVHANRPVALQDSTSRISERPRSRAPPEAVHAAS